MRDCVGLLAVPRALGPQVRTSSAKRASSAATGAASSGIHSEVRWSGSTTRSRSSQATSRTASSGRPRRWSDGDRRSVLHRQLDVGQHVAAVALADQQRAALPGRLDREAWPSTSRAPAATGSTPSRAQARSRNDSRGQDVDVDAAVGPEQLDGALGHQRRAGHGVEHLAVLGRRRPPRSSTIAAYTSSNGRRRARRRSSKLDGVGDGDGGRVPAGAQEPVRDALDGLRAAPRSQVRARRARARRRRPGSQRRAGRLGDRVSRRSPACQRAERDRCVARAVGRLAASRWRVVDVTGPSSGIDVATSASQLAVALALTSTSVVPSRGLLRSTAPGRPSARRRRDAARDAGRRSRRVESSMSGLAESSSGRPARRSAALTPRAGSADWSVRRLGAPALDVGVSVTLARPRSAQLVGSADVESTTLVASSTSPTKPGAQVGLRRWTPAGSPRASRCHGGSRSPCTGSTLVECTWRRRR